MNQTNLRVAEAFRPIDRIAHGDSVSQRIPRVASMLKSTRVTCVQFKYHGEFDQGVLNDPVYLLSDGSPVVPGVTHSLQSELCMFFSELLDLRFPQWANAEGARGEFQWHVTADVLAHAHIARYRGHTTIAVTQGV